MIMQATLVALTAWAAHGTECLVDTKECYFSSSCDGEGQYCDNSFIGSFTCKCDAQSGYTCLCEDGNCYQTESCPSAAQTPQPTPQPTPFPTAVPSSRPSATPSTST